MESTLLGLVLDSTSVISAERNEQPIPVFVEAILRMHGPINLSLSPVTVAELVHGVYRAKTPAAGQRRPRIYRRTGQPGASSSDDQAHRVARGPDRRLGSGEGKHAAF